MLVRTELFWCYSAKDIMAMPYEQVKNNVLEAAKPSTIEDVAVVVAKRRETTESPAEQLACSRILSALIDGPDVLEF